MNVKGNPKLVEKTQAIMAFLGLEKVHYGTISIYSVSRVFLCHAPKEAIMVLIVFDQLCANGFIHSFENISFKIRVLILMIILKGILYCQFTEVV